MRIKAQEHIHIEQETYTAFSMSSHSRKHSTHLTHPSLHTIMSPGQRKSPFTGFEYNVVVIQRLIIQLLNEETVCWNSQPRSSIFYFSSVEMFSWTDWNKNVRQIYKSFSSYAPGICLSMPIRCTWTSVFTAHFLLATPMKLHKK